MKREKVDKRYVIRLTESEAEVLEKRFALSGMSSVSAYLRQQVVNGIYLEYDHEELKKIRQAVMSCLLYTSPSPRDGLLSRMPSSA